jgi:histidine ammonia-lyase
VLARVLADGAIPPVRRWGAIGTGDLTALATLALCLRGERDWLAGGTARFTVADPDALAFVSSNAATVGEAALAATDVDRLLRATVRIAALSAVAVGASTEPFTAAVQRARPHPGQARVAAELRDLLGGGGPDGTGLDGTGLGGTEAGRRIQDPYGWRALAPVHGAAADTAAHLDAVVTVELNAAAENPLVVADEGTVRHNGNFHTAALALALDHATAGLAQTGSLSVARLASLMNPAVTGAAPFLATGPAGGSGLLILEYVAQAALAELRHAATVTPGVPATLSLGTEDHAGFGTQAAHRCGTAVPAYRTILACELLAAARAVRLGGATVPVPLLPLYQQVIDLVDPDLGDRSLESDLDALQTLDVFDTRGFRPQA